MANFSRVPSMVGQLGCAPNNWYQSRFDPVRGSYEELISSYHGFWEEASSESPSLPPISAMERRFQTLEGMVLTLEIKSDKLDQKLDELIREFNLSQIPTAMAPPHPPPSDPYDYPLPGPYGYSSPFSVPYDYYYHLQQHYSTPPPPTPHHYPSSSVQWQPMTTQITSHSHVSMPTPLQKQQWQYQPGFLPSHSEQYVSDEMSVRKESHEGPKSKAPYVFDEISVRVEAPHKEPEISGPLLDEGQAHQFETENESLEVATESTVRRNEESHEDMVFDKMYEKKSNSVLEDAVAEGNGAVEYLLASNDPSRDRVVDDDVVGRVEAVGEEPVASEKTDAADSPLFNNLMGSDLRTQAMVARHYIFGGHNEEPGQQRSFIGSGFEISLCANLLRAGTGHSSTKKLGIIINLGFASGICVNVLGPEFVEIELAALVDPFLGFEDDKAYISSYLKGLEEKLHLFSNNWVFADMFKLDLEEDRYLKYSCHQKSVLEELVMVWDPGIFSKYSRTYSSSYNLTTNDQDQNSSLKTAQAHEGLHSILAILRIKHQIVASIMIHQFSVSKSITIQCSPVITAVPSITKVLNQALVSVLFPEYQCSL